MCENTVIKSHGKAEMRGFINIDKPQNMTSSDVVVIVRGIMRRALGEKIKTGHLGTLDPMGTGVLPVALGTATRLFDVFSDKKKTYLASFDFGYETDTLDVWGKTVKDGGRIPKLQEIEEIIPSLIGEIDQIPPLYSAKSIGGKRAYDLARQGKAVELAAKRVTIYDIKPVGADDARFTFEITASGGTYIRSVARDMAYALGTFAAMSSIRRLQSGCFSVDKAYTIGKVEKNPLGSVTSVEDALADMPRFEIPERDVKHVLNGIVKSYDNLPDGIFAVTVNGEIVAIGEDEEGNLSLKTRL